MDSLRRVNTEILSFREVSNVNVGVFDLGIGDNGRLPEFLVLAVRPTLVGNEIGKPHRTSLHRMETPGQCRRLT